MTTKKTYTNRSYLDAVEDRVLVYDGAMGTSILNQNLEPKHYGGDKYWGYNDHLVITYPEAVEKVHRSFLEVGVDVIETDTFRSNRHTMKEYDLEDKAYEVNFVAAQLARRLADEYSTPEQPRFVAGSIGPTGMLPSADDPELSAITYDELAEIFREAAKALIEGGSDVLIIETSQDILEVKAAIHGIQLAFEDTNQRIPLQAQVTLDVTGRMLLGTDIQAALNILEGLPIDVVGLNCSTGPEHMREPIRFLGEHATFPVSCIPNAGLPLNVDGEEVYPLGPEQMAKELTEFVEKHNISIVGGCCGTTPEHLKVLVEAVGGRKHPARPETSVPRLSSSMTASLMQQNPAPTLLGERCNATGSRKFKRLLLEEDWDGILQVARDQVAGGAHALDISVAVTERGDEDYLMANVIKKLAMGIEVPLVIDTTEPEVMEIALKIAPGRCLLNSTHLEAGRPKMDQVLRIAKQHNAAVLILTIDEDGMAKTVERKVEVAKRIYDIAINEFGFKPEDLVYDVLTFPLSTGDPEFADSAVNTIEGIRQIKAALPGVFTSLGISNASFGLSAGARPLLNSILLYHCVQAGLDMAIVNAAHITPIGEIPENERILIEDLIFNRHPDALQKVIEYFENIVPPAPGQELADPTEGMTPEERLHWCIVHRRKDGVEENIDTIINRKEFPSNHETAVHILNNVLLPGMKEVGDKFGAGELILPFVLQSAEVMKKAVGHVEQYLEKVEGTTKGLIVLATVYGDVHDIGKNLVKTILSNNGYSVLDIGKQVPADKIINTAVEHNATAIGLSALLVSTSKQMPLIVNELQRRGLEFPVMIGGAAINRSFGRRILYTEDGSPYQPGVFYCTDAFEGLETMNQLTDPDQKDDFMTKLFADADMEKNRKTVTKKTAAPRERVPMAPADFIPAPPHWGPKTVNEMPLEMVFQHLYKNELFRLSWGAKNTHGEEWTKLEADFEERLDKMKREALKDGWLQPKAVYGYWPCNSDGDDLIIYAPLPAGDGSGVRANGSGPQEIARFSFPRQPDKEQLCLADYFLPASAGKYDVVAFQVVTVGKQADERFEGLQGADNYTEAYFTHGLAVQTAEATAEYMHQHIRRELGLSEKQGKRYSWGYPAIPDLDDHGQVFELLPAQQELAMQLTSSYQLVPEQSTAAIVLHHPKAKYYSVGVNRTEQLMKA